MKGPMPPQAPAALILRLAPHLSLCRAAAVVPKGSRAGGVSVQKHRTTFSARVEICELMCLD